MGSFVENGSKMTFNLFAEILTSGPILFGFAEIVAAAPSLSQPIGQDMTQEGS